MERLQPRNENQNTKAMSLARKLLKLAFWSFAVIMGLVGLWFTVAWSVPREAAVDVTLKADTQVVGTSDQQGAAEIRVSAVLSCYTLRNEKDVLKGELEVDGTKLPMTVEFEIGEEFGMYTPDNEQFRLLISRDGQLLMLLMPGKAEAEADRLYTVPGEEAAAQERWQGIFDAHPEWEKLFDPEP